MSYIIVQGINDFVGIIDGGIFDRFVYGDRTYLINRNKREPLSAYELLGENRSGTGIAKLIDSPEAIGLIRTEVASRAFPRTIA